MNRTQLIKILLDTELESLDFATLEANYVNFLTFGHKGYNDFTDQELLECYQSFFDKEYKE